MADDDVAVDVAVTGGAFDLVVDAAVLEAGLQRQGAQTECLLAVIEDDVAALALHIQITAHVLRVGDVPIAGQHHIMLYRRFIEIVQFGHVQVVGTAFGGDALFFIPHETLQIQAAAHRRPACGAQADTFGACFQIEAVLQMEVERAADIKRADCTLPLVTLVQAAVGGEIEAVGFAVKRHAAAAAYALTAAGAVNREIDGIDAGGRFLAGDDNLAALGLKV